MMKTILVAALAWCAGAALGHIVSAATIRRLRRRVREMRAGGKPPKKMGVMDRVLVFEAVALIIYTAAVLAVFWHTGAEPVTLTACVFAVCGLENGVMGWIRTSQERNNKPSGTGAGGQEPPQERPEPPDVGI